MQNVIFQNDIHYTTGFKCFNRLNTEAGKARANQQYYIIYVLRYFLLLYQTSKAISN